ncbi:MAG: protein kinase [Planctomycetes bacterium]|nr:protein kinase [Planctomycetota bacterium]
MAGPSNDNQKHSLEEVLQQFVNLQLRGEAPEIDEFAGQYPEFEDQIRKRIRKLQKINNMFDTLVQPDESDFEAIAVEQNLVGEKISSFEIIEMIGSGGMGVVYLARDTKLKRSVAIKSIPAALASDSTARKRFRREAEILASLNHPNIAVIHDIIEQEDGAGYLVLEYVPGETLSEHIARGPLKLEEALSNARQIAEAVSAAHKKGIIHRDLKSSNIKITPEGRVKVLDFGLAKFSITKDKTIDITTTEPGHVIGTPAYMSPEQTRGKDTDHRTDIWSFGCIMFQMLTSKFPFEGHTATDTMAKIIEGQPDWEAMPKDTPANIRALMQNCLKKNQDQRLGDIADASIEISKTLSKPATTQTTKWRKTAMIISTVVIGILLSVIALKFIPQKEIQLSPEDIRLVVLPFENLSPFDNEYFAACVTDEITTRLAGIHGLTVISRQSAIEYKNKEKSSPKIAQQLDIDYLLEGTIKHKQPSDPNSGRRITIHLIRASDGAHVWDKPYEDNMDDIFNLLSEVGEQLAQALGITLQVPERKALAFRPTENKKAYEHYLSGKEYYNRRDYRLAIEMLDKTVKLDPNLALAYAQLSRAHLSMYWNSIDRTQARLKKAEKAVFKAQNINPDLPEVHLALGHYYYHGLREYDRALKEFAIVLRTQPYNDEALAFTCYVQRKQGKFEKALANIIRASEINPLNQELAMDIPEILIVLERYSEAEYYCNRAISRFPFSAHPYRVKAWVYLYWEGDIETARAVLEEASQYIESAETKYVDILSILDVFEGNYQDALDRISSTPNRPGPFLPRIFRIAQIHGYMDNERLAKQSYDEARRTYESRIQEGSEGASNHSMLGIAFAGLGLKEEAVREAEIAMKMKPVTLDAFFHSGVKHLAYMYLILEDHEKAIDQLEFLLTNPDHWSAPFVKIDPTWKPLHYHPRFQKLVESGNSKK